MEEKKKKLEKLGELVEKESEKLSEPVLGFRSVEEDLHERNLKDFPL